MFRIRFGGHTVCEGIRPGRRISECQRASDVRCLASSESTRANRSRKQPGLQLYWRCARNVAEALPLPRGTGSRSATQAGFIATPIPKVRCTLSPCPLERSRVGAKRQRGRWRPRFRCAQARLHPQGGPHVRKLRYTPAFTEAATRTGIGRSRHEKPRRRLPRSTAIIHGLARRPGHPR